MDTVRAITKQDHKYFRTNIPLQVALAVPTDAHLYPGVLLSWSPDPRSFDPVAFTVMSNTLDSSIPPEDLLHFKSWS